MSDVQSAWTALRDTSEAIPALAGQLGALPPEQVAVIVFFCSPAHDGLRLSAGLKASFPSSLVVGCTTAGEFSQRGAGQGGVAALALGRGLVSKAAASLVELPRGGSDDALAQALSRAGDELAAGLGARTLAEVDPARHVGLVLLDGLSEREEAINFGLGSLCPMLPFVGGSASDDLLFKETRLFVGDRTTDAGCALLVLQTTRAFQVVRTTSFQATGAPMVVTSADPARRLVLTLDGKPAAQVYAERLGTTSDQLRKHFRAHPLGQVIGDQVWTRSPRQALPDGSLRFYCQVPEGCDCTSSTRATSSPTPTPPSQRRVARWARSRAACCSSASSASRSSTSAATRARRPGARPRASRQPASTRMARATSPT